MLATVKKRDRICELAGEESLLNPCTQLDTRLHPGLDPEVGSSLDDEYSVTESPPVYYCHVKWWYGGPR